MIGISHVFNETLQFFTTTKSRIFNVRVQSTMVAANLDVVAVVGANSAYIVEATVLVTASVVIALEPVKQNPMVSAVEFIYQGPAAPIAPAPTPISVPAPISVPMPVAVPLPTSPGPFQDLLINCGSTASYVESAGVRTWKADQYFIGGGTFTVASTIEITDTFDDRVYQSERNGDFQYEIPVPPGEYEIIIHLTEVSNRQK